MVINEIVPGGETRRANLPPEKLAELRAKDRYYKQRQREADPEGTRRKAREWFNANRDKLKIYNAPFFHVLSSQA